MAGWIVVAPFLRASFNRHTNCNDVLPLEHAGMSLLPILKGEIQARPIAHGIGIHGSFPYGYAPMQETRGFFERHYFLTNK